jgi:hypothetical protein
MDVKQGRTCVREDSQEHMLWYLDSNHTYVCSTSDNTNRRMERTAMQRNVAIDSPLGRTNAQEHCSR